jgi:hypothetical protein
MTGGLTGDDVCRRLRVENDMKPSDVPAYNTPLESIKFEE